MRIDRYSVDRSNRHSRHHKSQSHIYARHILRAFLDAKFEIISSYYTDLANSFSIDNIIKLESLSCPMVALK
jgi:hypothetical protein